MMFRVDDIRATHHTGGNVPIRELEECVWVLRKAIEKVCGWGWWGHTLLWPPIVTFKGWTLIVNASFYAHDYAEAWLCPLRYPDG